jgi:hypothetical protein
MYRCFLLLLLPLFSLQAQTFRASALAGVNLNQIDGDDLFGFHKAGLNAGLRVVAVLNERWRVGPEILFSQQGAVRNRKNTNISDFREIDFDAVEIPLMAYYKDWRLTAEAGLSYQRVIDFRVTDFRGEDISDDVPLRDDLLAIKFGVTLYVTPRIGLNFRWSKHLTDIQEPDEPGLRGRSLSLRAVYTFGSGETLPGAIRNDTPTNEN